MKIKFSSKLLAAIPFQLAEHAFLFFLALTCVALIFSAGLFYFFVWLPQESDPPIPANVMQFQIGAFDRIMEIQDARQQRFQSANILDPLSLF